MLTSEDFLLETLLTVAQMEPETPEKGSIFSHWYKQYPAAKSNIQLMYL